jgi:hypothetical protein
MRNATETNEIQPATIADAELAALVTAWPTLPEHIRAAIRALLGTVDPAAFSVPS